MPTEKDEKELRYFKDDEEDQEEELESHAIGSKAKSAYEKATRIEVDAARVEGLMNELETLIEQLGHLYTLFFQGIEKRPPIENRAHLDKEIILLQNAMKSTPALKFRANSVISTYLTHRDRWDKKMKDLERGK